MKRNFSHVLILLSILGLLINTSCKKQETETYISFLGDLSVTVPAYIHVGDTVVFTQAGLTKTDGSTDIGYYWNVSDIDTKNDTTRLEGDPATVTGYRKFVAPDTLGTFTASCGGFATGYYSVVGSADFTTIKYGFNTGSITDFDIFVDDIHFIDPRDGKEYLCHEVGDLVWMRQNMEYRELGVPMKNVESATPVFGRFYSWNELPSVCPEGWRVPSEEDWAYLVSYGVNTVYEPFTRFQGCAGNLMVNARFNGNLLWEFWPKVPITNRTAFSAMPFGFATKDDQGVCLFQGLDFYAAFWTSSTYEGDPVFRYIFEENNDVFFSKVGKEDILLPVRCVREK